MLINKKNTQVMLLPRPIPHFNQYRPIPVSCVLLVFHIFIQYSLIKILTINDNRFELYILYMIKIGLIIYFMFSLYPFFYFYMQKE